MRVFYKGQSGNLHCISTDSNPTKEGVADTFQYVMEHLHSTGEVYFKPILILIQGGKN